MKRPNTTQNLGFFKKWFEKSLQLSNRKKWVHVVVQLKTDKKISSNYSRKLTEFYKFLGGIPHLLFLTPWSRVQCLKMIFWQAGLNISYENFYILCDPINSNLLALSVYKSLTIPRVLQSPSALRSGRKYYY